MDSSNAERLLVEGAPPARGPGRVRPTYSDAYVARVKGLLAVFTVKGVSLLTGLDPVIVRDWKRGKRRGEVAPDAAILVMISAMLRDRESYVGRIKALLGFMTISGVCRLTGLPWEVVRAWKFGKRRGDVAVDTKFAEQLKTLVLEGSKPPDVDEA